MVWATNRVWLTSKRYASAAITIRNRKFYWIDDDLHEHEYEWEEMKEELFRTYSGRPVAVNDHNKDIEYVFDTAEDAVRWVEEHYFSGA